jgi:putative acetyltransferase
MQPAIRDARDEDAAGLIDLIARCWADYPGCVMDVDGEVPELRAIASHFRAKHGRFWVAEVEGRVVGSVGVAPVRPGWAELFKLYVDHACRRRGLASRLADLAEAEAARLGAARIEFWSDTRFVEAHRFYAARGYAGGVETRALHDLSNTVEYRFEKGLTAP